MEDTGAITQTAQFSDHRIWDAMPAYCLVLDSQNLVVEMNPAARVHFGEVNAHLATGLYRLLRRTQFSLLRSACEETRRGRPQVVKDLRIKLAGKTLVLDVSLRRLDVANGSLLAVLTDRTEESVILQETVMLRNVIDSTQDLIYVCDWSGKIRIVNQPLARMFGARPEEIVSHYREEIMDIGSATEHRMTDQMVLNSGEAITRTEHLKTGRNVMIFESRKFPIMDRSGNTIAVGGISRDVTRERQFNDQLRFTEAIFQNSRDSIAVTDVSNAYQRVNRAFELLTGLSNHALAGRSIYAIAPKRRDTHLFDQAVDVVKSVGYWSGELTIWSVNGVESSVWARITALRDDDDTVTGFLWILTDLSEIRTANTIRLAAERANEAKSQFLTKMSHELRTPLAGVLGTLDLVIGRSAELAPDILSKVQMAYSSGETLLSIVNDLLDMSRLEAGKIELDTQPFDLTELVTKVCAIHRVVAQQKDVRFSVAVAPESRVNYLGDATRVAQVLHNLIGNAVKFTGEGGSVSVSVSGTAPLMITVADTGIGMSPEELSRVFSPFEQADNTISRRFGGTGLGLPIVKSMLDLMKGKIHSTSEKGVGSKFTVELPLPVMPRSPYGNETLRNENNDLTVQLNGVHVLVADDSEINREVLTAYLEKAGAEVTVAVDGLDAVKIFDTARFDLLCLDISMPGLDGNEVLARIQRGCEEEGRVAPPAIAVTANAMSHQKQHYLEIGFDACLTKPFRAGETVDLIRSVLYTRKRGETVDAAAS